MDHLSYHLLNEKGEVLQHDGRRTNPPDIGPGETKEVQMAVELPVSPGQYQIEVDMVRDGVTWFAPHGNATPRIKLQLQN